MQRICRHAGTERMEVPVRGMLFVTTLPLVWYEYCTVRTLYYEVLRVSYIRRESSSGHKVTNHESSKLTKMLFATRLYAVNLQFVSPRRLSPLEAPITYVLTKVMTSAAAMKYEAKTFS
jgi:hypothetical protein